MRKKKYIIFILIIASLIIAVPIMAIMRSKKNTVAQAQMQHIIVWQIDGFEGGKGSRANYLQGMAQKCFGKEKTYVSVISLSADAARKNLTRGEAPDIISYPSGFYGIENFINDTDYLYKTWCRGGYCILTLDCNSDFSDVNAENTVINGGKDNLTSVAALLCGVKDAQAEEPTNAYLQLISGKCKYLLGTQRDIFRLKTRNVQFAVKPVTQFNDLYQSVSIVTSDNQKYESCKKFIGYIINNGNAASLGLFDGGGELIAEELSCMQGITFESVLIGPCGAEYIEQLKSAAKLGDINKIKSLLKC